MLTRQRLEAILGRLPGLTIGVVGDLFLDRYLDLDATLTEPSLETGLDAYQVVAVRSGREAQPGGEVEAAQEGQRPRRSASSSPHASMIPSSPTSRQARSTFANSRRWAAGSASVTMPLSRPTSASVSQSSPVRG